MTTLYESARSVLNNELIEEGVKLRGHSISSSDMRQLVDAARRHADSVADDMLQGFDDGVGDLEVFDTLDDADADTIQNIDLDLKDLFAREFMRQLPKSLKKEGYRIK